MEPAGTGCCFSVGDDGNVWRDRSCRTAMNASRTSTAAMSAVMWSLTGTVLPLVLLVGFGRDGADSRRVLTSLRVHRCAGLSADISGQCRRTALEWTPAQPVPAVFRYSRPKPADVRSGLQLGYSERPDVRGREIFPAAVSGAS